MKHRLTQSLRGYVKIRLGSRQPERFLNLCANGKIVLWDLQYTDGSYEMCLSVKDFFRLPAYCRKSKSRVHILEKHGMPFFLYRSKKRKAFFLGIFLCAFLLLFLSLFIWNIHVTGNYANSTGSILHCLEENGIYHGIFKGRLDCAKIAALLREKFSNITWVSAKVEGTQLILEIKENVDGYAAEEISENPRSLVAAKDGIVVKMITRSGTPLVSPGDLCKKGDVLVEGILTHFNDSSEITGYEYVRADADVYLETDWYYYDEFPMNHDVRVYEAPGKPFPVLQFGNYRLLPEMLLFSSADEGQYDTKINMRQCYLTENFALPLYVGTMQKLPYTVEQTTYTGEEAKSLSERHFLQFSENLSKKGVQICENNVKIECTKTSCKTSGVLRAVWQAVEEQPVEEKEAPLRKEQSLDE